jgi:hypothetical protein
MHLAKYFSAPRSEDGLDALRQATQHARHAVSVEDHPLPLTTLGKILLVQMTVAGYSPTAAYEEAFDRLTDAIILESNWRRKAAQPFVLLFRGTVDFLKRGGRITQRQTEKLLSLIDDAKTNWKRDKEVTDAIELLESALKG